MEKSCIDFGSRTKQGNDSKQLKKKKISSGLILQILPLN